MRTIDPRPVRFGELAGPLVHGGRFFDWQLISTQAIAAAFECPFQGIVTDGGIPFAPVVVSTSVERYLTFEDSVTIETVPRRVGESSVELVYAIEDGDGESLATARMTHVTIGPDGSALPLPEETRAALTDARVDSDPAVGPAEDLRAGEDDTTGDEDYPTFSASFPIRSPHIERSALAYFEEYPRFADIALEEYLAGEGTNLDELSGETQPFRLRDWRWEFNSPVPFESVLDVECDVVGVTEETVRVAHTMSTDGQVRIEGTSDYGCFDRSGTPVAFDAAALDPFVS
jgi:acyl-CoA thioesterase FadM